MIHPLRVAGLGGGAVLAASAAITMVLQAAPPQQSELVGLLGLPGALLSLTGAFLLGVKAVQALREPKSPERTPRYRDIAEIFTSHEREDQRRAEEMVALLERLEQAVDRRHQENMAKLQRIEDMGHQWRRG